MHRAAAKCGIDVADRPTPDDGPLATGRGVASIQILAIDIGRYSRGPLDFSDQSSREWIIEAPIAYLQFDGTCQEALTFYAEVLGGEVTMLSKYSDAPPGMGMPSVPDHWIMHGRVVWPRGGMLMGSDGGMERYEGVKGVSLSCNCADVAEGEKLFAALSAGGTVRMPFQSMFWSPGFGLLTDRFGVPWMVNVEGPAPS